MPLGFVADLQRHGARIALIDDLGALSYTDLIALIRTRSRELGHGRLLTLIELVPIRDSVITYLAALTSGHAVIVCAPSQTDDLALAYSPDLVVRAERAGELPETNAKSAVSTDGSPTELSLRPGNHVLHPDLCLLLSTSGSTGSPKLVRLSYDNVESNARGIETALGIHPDDRAITSLPLHYCYGLSVLHSHLAAGASVVLSDLSVADEAWWRLVGQREVTTIAAVPHTIDLLGKVGFPEAAWPALRNVTVAGGRLPARHVRELAAIGRRAGWRLHLMYGQTEATARMAVLPSELVDEYPGSIGLPLTGGQFTLAPVDALDEDGGIDHFSADHFSADHGEVGSGGDEGELIYTGPGVMLGYAGQPADLARGREIQELRTGDLARRTRDGSFIIVGRRARFAKILGLRIDLDRVDSQLAELGFRSATVEAHHGLGVLVQGRSTPSVAQHVGQLTGLPVHLVDVRTASELPTTTSGKTDLAAVADAFLAATEPDRTRSSGEPPALDTAQQRLIRAYSEVLQQPATPRSTFLELGGDSLSFVEIADIVEAELGYLPRNWPQLTIAAMTAASSRAVIESTNRPSLGSPEANPEPTRKRAWLRTRAVDTSVVLRALGIVFIVGTHANTLALPGMAHVLLAVAGYNFARFQLTSADRAARVRRQIRSIGRIAVPSVLWIGAVAAVTGYYQASTAFLLHGLVAGPGWSSQWHYWFIEVLVYLLVIGAALTATPLFDRIERRCAWGVPMAIVGLGLLLRHDVVDIGLLETRPSMWLFAVGWAAARSSMRWQRLLLSLAAVVGSIGYFNDTSRDVLILSGLLVLTWLPTLRVPARLVRFISVLASASLFIYLVHWQVLRLDAPSWLLLPLSLVAGVLYLAAYTRSTRALAALLRRRRSASQQAGGDVLDVDQSLIANNDPQVASAFSSTDGSLEGGRDLFTVGGRGRTGDGAVN